MIVYYTTSMCDGVCYKHDKLHKGLVVALEGALERAETLLLQDRGDRATDDRRRNDLRIIIHHAISHLPFFHYLVKQLQSALWIRRNQAASDI